MELPALFASPFRKKRFRDSSCVNDAVGGQHLRVALTAQNGSQDLHSGHTGDDVVQLKVHLHESFLNVLNVGGCIFDEHLRLPAPLSSSPNLASSSRGAAQSKETGRFLASPVVLVMARRFAPSGPLHPVAGAILCRRNSRMRVSRTLLIACCTIIPLGCAARRVAVSAEPNCYTVVAKRKLTSTGVITSVSISADGRYLAWVDGTDNQRDSSVSIKSRADGNAQRFLPVESDLEYRSVALSPDGTAAFVTRGRRGGTSTLDRISRVGEETTKIAADVDSAAGVSPDGRQIAFIRASDTSASLVTCNSDGTGERVVATVAGRQGFAPRRPAWSPDARRIAVYSVKPLESSSSTSPVALPGSSAAGNGHGATDWRGSTMRPSLLPRPLKA